VKKPEIVGSGISVQKANWATTVSRLSVETCCDL
jgi:hypothetical protein